ncbi:MAG: rhodanese-like domain-containing protein [Actinomycetota bacterium]
MSQPDDYAGEVTLEEAWALLRDDPGAVLIDVRTAAEWSFVGVPDLGAIGKEARFVEWISFPSGAPNPNFVEQASDGLEPGQPVVLLCRSGARSLGAARAMTAIGLGPAYNVTAGFEGPLDEAGHRAGGWKHAGLDWRQS